MSKITIVNNCKYGSDARVLQVVSKFMDEKLGNDIDYIGNGVWEISEGEGIYTLTVTDSSSVVGDVKIKVTLELTDIEN